MRSFSRRALVFGAAAVLLVAVGARPSAARPVTAPDPRYSYAGVQGTGSVSGIDGYIRGSTTLALPTNQHRANWVNLCDSNCAEWVQTGVLQGVAGNGTINISAPTQMHIYVENNWQDCYYEIFDFGPPPTANYPYYISYDGRRVANDCGSGNMFEYAFRVGSFTNPPIEVGYMPSLLGEPSSMTELYSPDGAPVPHNNDFFGTDDNHNPNPSYGLHLLTGGAWQGWTASVESGSQSSIIGFAPPSLHMNDNFWSFSTGN